MHTGLDAVAQRSPLRDISPEFKFIFVLSTIFILISSYTPTTAVIAALFFGFIGVYFAKIPLGMYIRLLSLPFVFTLPAVIVFPFLQGVEGLKEAFLLIARVAGSASALYFLILTTPAVDLFYLLSRFLPDAVVELSMLVYRYIFVVLEEAERMHTALNSRGISGLRAEIKAFSLLVANLFLRAMSRGDRLTVAMESRGYQSKLMLLRRKSKIPLSWISTAVLFDIFLLLLWRAEF